MPRPWQRFAKLVIPCEAEAVTAAVQGVVRTLFACGGVAEPLGHKMLKTLLSRPGLRGAGGVAPRLTGTW